MRLRTCLTVSHANLLALARTSADRACAKAAYFAPTADGAQAACLVAHVDTVWDRKRVTPRVYFDRQRRVFWSPDGLGADDRAGVFAAFMVRRQTGCAVLLTDEEESMGLGASAALADKSIRAALAGHKLLVELDRQGARQAVIYSDQPTGFLPWVRSFGFRTGEGTFTDIALLGPALRLPAVNLSVGYYGEHTRAERLRLNELNWTIGAAVRMVKAAVPDFGAFPKSGKRRKRHVWLYDDYADVQDWARRESIRDWIEEHRVPVPSPSGPSTASLRTVPLAGKGAKGTDGGTVPPGLACIRASDDHCFVVTDASGRVERVRE